MKSEVQDQLPGERKSLLAETLYNRVLTLQLMPGETLNELALCDEFGLSRSTVRTTLLQLEADGLLDLRRHRAPTVVAMSVTTLQCFEQSAALIYPASVRLAALNARSAEHEELHELLDCLYEALEDEDLAAWLSLENILQRRIEHIAANPFLTPALRRLQIDHSRLSRMFYAHQAWQRMHQDLSSDTQAWRRIISAIATGDGEGAAQAARSHLHMLCQRLGRHTAPLHKESPHIPSTPRAPSRQGGVEHVIYPRQIQ